MSDLGIGTSVRRAAVVFFIALGETATVIFLRSCLLAVIHLFDSAGLIEGDIAKASKHYN